MCFPLFLLSRPSIVGNCLHHATASSPKWIRILNFCIRRCRPSPFSWFPMLLMPNDFHSHSIDGPIADKAQSCLRDGFVPKRNDNNDFILVLMRSKVPLCWSMSSKEFRFFIAISLEIYREMDGRWPESMFCAFVECAHSNGQSIVIIRIANKWNRKEALAENRSTSESSAGASVCVFVDAEL